MGITIAIAVSGTCGTCGIVNNATTSTTGVEGTVCDAVCEASCGACQSRLTLTGQAVISE